jgi:uncharacterized protein (TIGR00299 family) protein
VRIAYFDCFAGASGDMILGSLLDAGLALDALKGELAKLHLTHYDLQVASVTKEGISGSQALVTIDDHHHHHHHRHLHDIEQILGKSDLEQVVKERSISIFRRLAEAEAHVHRTTVDHIHFHEVGAMDAIIDVVGSVAGLAALGVEKIYCSALHVGSGTVECAHGTLPVPAPATANLIQGKPIYSTGVKGELLTPTGAAILTTLATGFGHMPPMTVDKVGYGAGMSNFPIPNLLRLVIGESAENQHGFVMEDVAVAETNLGDTNPQICDHLIREMLDMGALDVFVIPMHMENNRPGNVVTVICAPDRQQQFSDFLIREATTTGLRWRLDHRIKAHRSLQKVETPYGPVTVKVAEAKGNIINVTPEYEDCKRLAMEKSVSLQDVMEQARIAAEATLQNPRQ